MVSATALSLLGLASAMTAALPAGATASRPQLRQANLPLRAAQCSSAAQQALVEPPFCVCYVL